MKAGSNIKGNIKIQCRWYACGFISLDDTFIKTMDHFKTLTQHKIKAHKKGKKNKDKHYEQINTCINSELQ